jgi:hypothetical protein
MKKAGILSAPTLVFSMNSRAGLVGTPDSPSNEGMAQYLIFWDPGIMG